MPTDTQHSAPRRNTQPAYTPPQPVEKQISPWIPFAITFLLITAVAAGLFFFIDSKFDESQTSLLKTNNFVVALDTRLKKIEDNIAQSDAQANAEGSSLTGKLMNLETRIIEAEKNIESNKASTSRQASAVEEIRSSVNQVSNNLSDQNSKITANSTKVEALSQQITSVTNTANAASSAATTASNSVETLDQKVQSNTQAIETIDAHRTRMSSAIQSTQADVARLIRLYEKDNPEVKRVH